MNLGSIIMLTGDKGSQSLLDQGGGKRGVEIAKLKSLFFLLKNALSSLTNVFPNGVFLYDFKVHF